MVFFFSDDTMHKVYEDQGNYNILWRIPQILYSSVISSVIHTILKFLSLSQLDILNFKKDKSLDEAMNKAKKLNKCIKIKFCIFFGVSILFMSFFWYFISCFCAVYSNTKKILIDDTLVSFGLSMLYPFGLNLLPGMFRMPALRAKKKDKQCLFKFSGILSLV